LRWRGSLGVGLVYGLGGSFSLRHILLGTGCPVIVNQNNNAFN